VALAVVGLIGSSLTLVVSTLGLLLWDRFAVVARAVSLSGFILVLRNFTIFTHIAGL